MTKNNNVPQIRFKGFTDTWEQRKVGDVLSESRDAGHSGDIAKKLTVKLWGKGVYAKDDKGSAATQYFTRHAGQFIYSKLDFLNSAFGVIPKELESYESTADLPAFDCLGVEPYFMFYRAIQPSFYLMNGMIADGSRKAKRIHVETFLDMPLDLPSIEEQQKVASYFIQLDNLITLHQRKCETLKKLKKSMLQKMFPKNGKSVPEIRFAGFTDAWEQRKLGECVTFLDTMRKPLKESEREKGIYPYYGASGIVDYVSDYIFDEELVLLSEDGANITDRNYPVCFLASGKYWVNNHAHVLKVNAENENNFICNSLERMDFTQYNSGMAMPKLNKDVCYNIPLFCPVYEEQKQIGDFFRHLDALITLHQRKLETLKKLKKSMLQKMFI